MRQAWELALDAKGFGIHWQSSAKKGSLRPTGTYEWQGKGMTPKVFVEKWREPLALKASWRAGVFSRFMRTADRVTITGAVLRASPNWDRKS